VVAAQRMEEPQVPHDLRVVLQQLSEHFPRSQKVRVIVQKPLKSSDVTYGDGANVK